MLSINVTVEERPPIFHVWIFLPCCVSHDKFWNVLYEVIYF